MENNKDKKLLEIKLSEVSGDLMNPHKFVIKYADGSGNLPKPRPKTENTYKD